MVPLIAWFSLAALAAEPDPGPVYWILPGAEVVEINSFSGGCPEKPTGQHAPAGLYVHVRTYDDANCGDKVLLADPFPRTLDFPSYRLPAAALSKTPPKKNVWDAAPVQSKGWTQGSLESAVYALPVDGVSTEPFAMAYGEPIDVLDKALGVIRTSAGREVLIRPYALETEENPFEERVTGTKRDHRLRVIAGKTKLTAPITALPPSKALTAAVGTVFEVEIDPRWLRPDRAFVGEWVDPIGQPVEHICEDFSREPEPCGRYWLDFQELGGWWVEKEERVLVVYDGLQEHNGEKLPSLRIVVRNPWSDYARVTPAWDGYDPSKPLPPETP